MEYGLPVPDTDPNNRTTTTNELKKRHWYIKVGFWFQNTGWLRKRRREKRREFQWLLPEFLQLSSCWGTRTENASRSGASNDSGLRISLSQRLMWSSLVSDGPWMRGTSFSFTPSPEPERQELKHKQYIMCPSYQNYSHSQKKKSHFKLWSRRYKNIKAKASLESFGDSKNTLITITSWRENLIFLK